MSFNFKVNLASAVTPTVPVLVTSKTLLVPFVSYSCVNWLSLYNLKLNAGKLDVFWMNDREESDKSKLTVDPLNNLIDGLTGDIVPAVVIATFTKSGFGLVTSYEFSTRDNLSLSIT